MATPPWLAHSASTPLCNDTITTGTLPCYSCRRSIENGIKSGIESGLVSIYESIKPEIEGWLKIPEPTGPFERIRLFTAADQPFWFVGEEDCWLLKSHNGRTVNLFEISEPDPKECVILCRAQVRTELLSEIVEQQLAELQLWVVRSGCSFGRSTPIERTINWHTYEVPFHFKREQHPSLIEIDVRFKDSGTVWIRNVELLQAPL